ncbi:MAG: hypothetical protein V3S45_07465, partial [Kiloniellales bacterium]
ETLERLDVLLRAAPRQGGGALLGEQAAVELGWSPEQLAQVLRALGFAPAVRARPGEPTAWRRRQPAAAPETTAAAASPFAALAALKPQPAEPRARRPRRRRRAGGGA